MLLGAIIVDTDKYWLNGNQFSNAVAGSYTVPDPQKDLEGYTQHYVRSPNKKISTLSR